MVNSIRTPKQGTNTTSRRIAMAVDDEAWQKFRLSLKGIPTSKKLSELNDYWVMGFAFTGHDYCDNQQDVYERCSWCIRVHNYLTALARGGQIAPSNNYIQDMRDGKLVIRK